MPSAHSSLTWPSGSAETCVERLPHRTDRAVADDREIGEHIHARRVGVAGHAARIGALIDQAHARHARALLAEQRRRHRRGGPDLDGTGRHHLAGDPLLELPERQHEPVVLAKERRDVRQADAVAIDAEHASARAHQRVDHSQRTRSAARADGIEQVDNLLVCDRRRERDACRRQFGEGCAQAARPRDDARDACAEVVGALEAEHLQRQARHRTALDARRAVVVEDGAAERREEPGRRGTKTRADDVDTHVCARHR